MTACVTYQVPDMFDVKNHNFKQMIIRLQFFFVTFTGINNNPFAVMLRFIQNKSQSNTALTSVIAPQPSGDFCSIR